MTGLMLIRLLPLVLVAIAAAAWFNDVQGGGPYVERNLLPLAAVLLLSGVTLWRGGGHWRGAGWRLPLGTAGFAIPAIGLTAYLHYAYAVNLHGMFGDPASPGELFRFLPWYTMVAGAVGFAIGWIIAKNL